jgi:hypothetical protein
MHTAFVATPAAYWPTSVKSLIILNNNPKKRALNVDDLVLKIKSLELTAIRYYLQMDSIKKIFFITSV